MTYSFLNEKRPSITQLTESIISSAPQQEIQECIEKLAVDSLTHESRYHLANTIFEQGKGNVPPAEHAHLKNQVMAAGRDSSPVIPVSA